MNITGSIFLHSLPNLCLVPESIPTKRGGPTENQIHSLMLFQLHGMNPMGYKPLLQEN